MLDSLPTCHKQDFLMGYKHVVCNTGGPGLYIGNFSILRTSNFSFLTCYTDACRYIKKVWIVDNEINAL